MSMAINAVNVDIWNNNFIKIYNIFLISFKELKEGQLVQNHVHTYLYSKFCNKFVTI